MLLLFSWVSCIHASIDVPKKKKEKDLQSMHCATAKAQSILDPESSVIIAFNAIL